MLNLCRGRAAVASIRHLWRRPAVSTALLSSYQSNSGFLSGSLGVSDAIFNRRYSFRIYSTIAGGDADARGDSLLRHYQAVVAATRDMGIGKDGKLPWKLPFELRFFKELTSTTVSPHKKNAVLMGRKTWEGIPLRYRPLPRRFNVVLSRSRNIEIEDNKDVLLCGSLNSALELLETAQYRSVIENVFIIGGGEILKEALSAPQCDAIHITEIETSIECDTFIPTFDLSIFRPWYSSSPVVENDIRYSFATYVKFGESGFNQFDIKSLPRMIFERNEECMYLKLVDEIISSGFRKTNKAGACFLSKFGSQMRFNLRKSFPLFTTTRLFWQQILDEVLGFIAGSTNAKIQGEKVALTQDDEQYREHINSIALVDSETIDSETETERDSSHSGQWGQFGVRCTDTNVDYSSREFHHLSDAIDKINNRSNNRRIVLSAWSPSDLQPLLLPSCDIFAQFYVSNGELFCQMYQSSANVALDVPRNVASFALLTSIIAHVCDLRPGELIYVVGEAFVYESNIGALQEQLQRHPRPFPILRINPEKKDIDLLLAADFGLVGYHPHT